MAIADKSFIGKGRFFARDRAGTAGKVAFGNVTACTLAHSESEISILDYTQSGGAKRNSRSRIDSVTLSMTLTDFTKDNLERFLRGSATTATGTTVTDESISVPATLDNDTLISTASIIDVDATVTVTTDPAGTTYTDGTDYEVVSSGIVILPGGAISASADLLVSYTSKTVDKVEAITGAAPEFEIEFAGVNEAQSDAEVSVTMHRVKLSLPQNFSLIADEFGALELTGELLADATKTGAGISQYYYWRSA